MQETPVGFLGWEDSMEESMTTHSVFLPGESPWTDRPGLQSIGSQRIRHDWATKHTHMQCHTEGLHFRGEKYHWYIVQEDSQEKIFLSRNPIMNLNKVKCYKHLNKIITAPLNRSLKITTYEYWLILALTSGNPILAYSCAKKKLLKEIKIWAVKGMLLHCWWEGKLIQPLWKTVWRVLKKLGIKPP